jgi:hypothetical protein
MTPQTDSAVKSHTRANGHRNKSTADDRSSVYDILYSQDKPSSFFSSDEQLQNSKVGSAGCKHLIDMKHHKAIPNKSNARAIFRQNLCTAVDYGIAWKMATSDIKSSEISDDTTKSRKRRKLSQQVRSIMKFRNDYSLGYDEYYQLTVMLVKDSCTTLYFLSTDIKSTTCMPTL